MTSSKTPLLQVNSLTKDFVRRGISARSSTVFHALQNVSFELFERQTYALVGESGSGKSTTGKIICALEKPTSGSVVFEDRNYVDDSPKLLRERIHGQIQMVFQDPFSALNPRKTIGDALIEALEIQGLGDSAKERRAAATEMLERVGLPGWHMQRYPHQFSGGQLQRVNIARALVIRPKVLILDESVSALDVSIQAQVLNLLQDLKEEFSLSYLFITHDLSVVRFIADRVGVLRKGVLVEEGDAHSIFAHPSTAYTRDLLASVPIPDPQRSQLSRVHPPSPTPFQPQTN
ncbi:MAG: ATP-binding cassette domain-containing protein [Bifidobacterium tibiigranuli]|jgi:ABC-type oligopeptide transport system ATPase subunit|uniref:ATP-binding cassette domain-containing protein n=1 Tax=Bifidobacterium tibiigranuli TaxID=2172043 RepID=UPI0026EAA232|nr:ATP-binding cassette domain-containing protein [Bifidobacterium tibiigranuli]MCI1672604.1 ATP-binding cassette domain-containing protein [Bifidobacterium tibiigranuli]MCI1712391.1 ATP-binding cassette domain-containing protein [Bifidobacterium tibiigranuli]MCI1834360.1 ATP-binding cassette domain-containing protein [Bifidobacterium tibiigranuli]